MAELFAPSDSEVQAMEDIPSYEEAVQRRPTKHIFSSKRFANGSFISLELNSMATNPAARPLFSQGATLEGRVLLDFKKRIGVKEIIITVGPNIITFYLINLNHDAGRRSSDVHHQLTATRRI
ncbi:hypothetical protein DL93DRAFT_2079351 [Clavulina sp. PMI_390]|nr:hypothetical protein DL93DRAFT_2079351 [Clavulina sp. PMI_390]